MRPFLKNKRGRRVVSKESPSPVPPVTAGETEDREGDEGEELPREPEVIGSQ